jgi:hypothetical protein
MTAQEVISLAFTRNLQVGHIKEADIQAARKRYVTSYIDDAALTATFEAAYVKPVIAFGVAVDIFDRLATEITDRGVVSFTSQGAAIVNREDKRATKREFARQRDTFIEMMTEAADDEGITVHYPVDENDQMFRPIYVYERVTRKNRL